MKEPVAGKPLVIRADADSRQGAGHVMRCLALAQAWQDAGGRALFLTAAPPPALQTRLQSEGMEVSPLQATPGSPEDARETAALARSRGAAWVGADGYHFGADYQRLLKDAGLRLLCIDDYGHAGHYCADLVLNQNIHALPNLYADREAHTRLLLGTRYVLLRREFWPWRGWRREIPAVARKVLVTLGGGDPGNVTLKVIQALAQVQIEGLEAVVVVGPANPHLTELNAAVQNSAHRIRLEANVTNMAELMAWADLAVTAGGSTCWETAFLGLPSLTIILATNQRQVTEELEKFRVAQNLRLPEDLSESAIAISLTTLLAAREIRKSMSLTGAELIDGLGVKRVLEQLTRKNLKLRRAFEADCEMVWKWRNAPEVRAGSFSMDDIPWESHKNWFLSRLKDPNCIFFIASNEDKRSVGQIRYEVRGTEATVSVCLDKNYRGSGYGTEIIRLGSQTLFSQSEIMTIHAYIKDINKSSLRAFKKVGFKNKDVTVIQGQAAIHMVLEAKQAK
jgi:UDP-2,4-diacetamido-2,4,6-trideoxy-beta-L-altropyranose hydrolase